MVEEETVGVEVVVEGAAAGAAVVQGLGEEKGDPDAHGPAQGVGVPWGINAACLALGLGRGRRMK